MRAQQSCINQFEKGGLSRSTLFHFYEDILVFWFPVPRFIFVIVQNYVISISYLTPYLWPASSWFSFSGCSYRTLCLLGCCWTDWRGEATPTSWGPMGSSLSLWRSPGLAWQPECLAEGLHPHPFPAQARAFCPCGGRLWGP